MECWRSKKGEITSFFLTTKAEESPFLMLMIMVNVKEYQRHTGGLPFKLNFIFMSHVFAYCTDARQHGMIVLLLPDRLWNGYGYQEPIDGLLWLLIPFSSYKTKR